MVDASLLAFNFTLGVLAFFSPCGFPMLPAYVAYYLPRGGADPSARALLRGLGGGALAALGALLVLGAIAGAAVALGAPFKARVVYLEAVGGIVVVALGLLTLAGRGPSFKFALRPSTRRGAAGVFAFGALYALVAASCVAPLLLGVVFSALAAPTSFETFLQVGAYGAGLASLLLVVTVLVATAQGRAVQALKGVLPHVERASGLVLVAVGLYLTWYADRLLCDPILRCTP